MLRGSRTSSEDEYESNSQSYSYPYSTNALQALTFTIQYGDSDTDEISRPFKPIMAHQIFGPRERITGYKNLMVNFDILPNSHQLYVSIKYENQFGNLVQGEVSNTFLRKLKWFNHMVRDKNLFIDMKTNENYKTKYGKDIGIFNYQDKQRCVKYLLSQCNINEKGFQEFHCRFSSLIVFFIDAASLIDMKDKNWLYFYIYKEVTLKDNSVGYIPVGFCTAYIFHTNHRGRVAQQFILPNFQRKGLGTKLLSTVYNYFKEIKNIHYITVESPCEDFTVLRDKLDLQLIINNPAFEKRKILDGYSTRMEHAAKDSYKICPPQVKHLYYILRCFYTMDSSDVHTVFMTFLKEKIYLGYKKKLSRMQTKNSQIIEIMHIRDIIREGYTNKYIEKDASIFIQSIRPQLNYLTRLVHN